MSEHRLELADVFRTYGDNFLALWERVLSRPQRKAFDDIRNCRTAALGGHVQYYDCGHCAISYNSCRNRSCPKCQGAARVQWLAEREADAMIADARRRANSLLSEVEDWADGLLAVLEVNLDNFLAAIRRGRERLHERSRETVVAGIRPDGTSGSS